MKRHKNLYHQIYDWGNIYEAYRNARRGKRGRPAAATFELYEEEYLLQIRDALRDQTWQAGSYYSFYIHEPKRRLISAAPFQDRVVHHALCNVIEPLFERRFIYDSYANRVGRGTHRANDRAQAFARKNKYVLQVDVKQFFPSIDHQIMKQVLVKVIGDPDMLDLCDTIINSGVGVLKEAYDMVWFDGDDLLAAERPRGLPIGNLTSQFWANCYMNVIDQFVKRELKCRAYVRYVDDLLLFGDDKERLWEWHTAIVAKMAELRLTIHPGGHPKPVTEGIPFLGFVIFPTHRRLKRRKGVHFQRKFKKLSIAYKRGEIPLSSVDATVQGWVNHVRYGDTWGLRRAILENVNL